MCLDRKPTRDQIIRDFKKKIEVEKGSYVGYKIFQKYRKTLYSPMYDGGSYELNEWITDDNKERLGYSQTDGRYKCGFHVYIDEKEGKRMLRRYKELNNSGSSGRYTLRKIFFNKILAYGYETNLLYSSAHKLFDTKVITTREMFIPKRRKY